MKKRYFYRFFKRLLDIMISIVGMLILIPVTLGVWLANLISKDNGPVFFKNKRIGLNGETIYIYKYRSMCMNAEAKLEELMANDPKIREEYLTNKKLENDPRITKVGKFIRKTSIDELPQFINVFLGNMTVVGPRPYLPREKEDMGYHYDNIIKVKPGVTGFWQVNGRSDTEFKERLEMDSHYVAKRSMWMDIKIFFKTIWVVIAGKGAK